MFKTLHTVFSQLKCHITCCNTFKIQSQHFLSDSNSENLFLAYNIFTDMAWIVDDDDNVRANYYNLLFKFKDLKPVSKSQLVYL